MSRKLFGLTVLLVLLGTSAASAQTIYGSAYSETFGGGVPGPSFLYSISATTGAATLIGPIGFPGVGSLATAPNGTLYGVANVASGAGTAVLITINTTTGAGTLVGDTGVSDRFKDIAFRSDGILFGYGAAKLYTFNIATGAATLVGPTNISTSEEGHALAFSSTNMLYTASDIKLDTLNPSTGAANTIPPPVPLTYSPAFGPNKSRANGMKFDLCTGTLYASVVNGIAETGTAANLWSLGIINITTGNVSRVGPTINGLDAIALPCIPPVAVPALSPFGQMLFVFAIFLSGLLFLRHRLFPAS